MAAEAQISIEGKGRALDTMFTAPQGPPLWRSVKYEEVYLYDYQMPKQAYAGRATYFDFYNYRRPHQALADLTPAEVYFANPLVTPTRQQLLL